MPMPDLTGVNPQITDAITQTNVKVLAEAPAQALAMVYQVLSQVVGLTMQNGASAQQNMQTVAGAATAKAVEVIMGSS
jgi:hypothetical protein